MLTKTFYGRVGYVDDLLPNTVYIYYYIWMPACIVCASRSTVWCFRTIFFCLVCGLLEKIKHVGVFQAQNSTLTYTSQGFMAPVIRGFTQIKMFFVLTSFETSDLHQMRTLILCLYYLIFHFLSLLITFILNLCCTYGGVFIISINNNNNNNCVLVKSGQIANPIIAIDDPVPYCSIRARLCLRIY